MIVQNYIHNETLTLYPRQLEGIQMNPIRGLTIYLSPIKWELGTFQLKETLHTCTPSLQVPLCGLFKAIHGGVGWIERSACELHVF